MSHDLENSLKIALERHLFSADGRTPPNLAEAIRYSLLAPGKRIRPRLAVTCAKMIGLPMDAALPPALALEMIHCFTLIHDDLPCMDDDDFRRGRPSNHKVFGEAIALLAGDALMALAVDCFLDAETQVDSRFFARGLRRLIWATGPRGVMGGQAAETLVREKPSLEDMRTMHAQKTGALFSAALLIPMDLAGVEETSAKGRALSLFAADLGLAFQAADDFDDLDEGKEADPTSILFYLSLEEAKSQTRSVLQESIARLSENWGQASVPLVTIAQEVLRKL